MRDRLEEVAGTGISQEIERLVNVRRERFVVETGRVGRLEVAVPGQEATAFGVVPLGGDRPPRSFGERPLGGLDTCDELVVVDWQHRCVEPAVDVDDLQLGER